MAAVAAAKRIENREFSVIVRMIAYNENGQGARFESEIRLSEDLTPREQRILYNSARSCEVHHLLRGPITFDETLRLTC